MGYRKATKAEKTLAKNGLIKVKIVNDDGSYTYLSPSQAYKALSGNYSIITKNPATVPLEKITGLKNTSDLIKPPKEQSVSTYVDLSKIKHLMPKDPIEVSREKEALEAYSFVDLYMNSPGFKRRLQEHNKETEYDFVVDPRGLTNSLVFDKHWNNAGYVDYTNYDSETLKETPETSNERGFMVVGKPYNSNISVMPHEYGHNLDLLIVPKNKYGQPTRGLDEVIYSTTYPILSEKYRKRYDEKDAPKGPFTILDKDVFDEEGMHDQLAPENYSDLLAFRLSLQESGIYDSLYSDTPFEIDHLYKYLKYLEDNNITDKAHTIYRLFRHYEPEDIVTMMNTIAQNNTNNNINDMTYAKRGIKLLPRKFYVGGNVTEIYPSNNYNENIAIPIIDELLDINPELNPLIKPVLRYFRKKEADKYNKLPVKVTDKVLPNIIVTLNESITTDPTTGLKIIIKHRVNPILHPWNTSIFTFK